MNTTDFLSKSLRKRAKGLRRGNKLILATIVAILGFAGYFFSTAGTIAYNDSDLGLYFNRFSKDMQDRLTADQNITPNTFDGIITKLGDTLEKSLTNSNRISMQTMVSANLTRVGAVFFAIFMTQIFISLYRYNTRLAVFYEGRADAIDYLDHNSNVSISDPTLFFTPATLDFGRMPQAPAEQLLELARELNKVNKA